MLVFTFVEAFRQLPDRLTTGPCTRASTSVEGAEASTKAPCNVFAIFRPSWETFQSAAPVEKRWRRAIAGTASGVTNDRRQRHWSTAA